MSIVAKSVGRVIDFTLPKLLPSRVRQRLVRSLSDHDHRDNLLDRARALGFRGTWTRDEPDLAGDSRGLARTLGETWLRMKDQQRRVPSVYLPAPTWASLLDSEWAGPRRWAEAGEFGSHPRRNRGHFPSRRVALCCVRRA